MTEAEDSKTGLFAKLRMTLSGIIPTSAAGAFLVCIPLVVLFMVCVHSIHTEPAFFLTCAGICLLFVCVIAIKVGTKKVILNQPAPDSSARFESEHGIVELRGIPPRLLQRPEMLEITWRVLSGAEPLPPPAGVVEDLASGRIRRLDPTEATKVQEQDNETIVEQLRKGLQVNTPPALSPPNSQQQTNDPNSQVAE